MKGCLTCQIRMTEADALDASLTKAELLELVALLRNDLAVKQAAIQLLSSVLTYLREDPDS